MRQRRHWILLLLLLAGCKSGSSPFARGGGGAGAERIPPPPVPASVTSKDKQKQVRGVLAGRVVDAYHQPRGGATLELIPLENAQDAKPTTVAADANGHFIIRGLEPGRKYKLAGRSRPGEPPLQGFLYATPPNVVLLMTLNEDAPARDTGAAAAQSDADPDAGPRAQSTGQGKQYLHEPDRGGTHLPPTNVPPAQSPREDQPPPGHLGQPVEADPKTETPPIKLRPDSLTDNRRAQGIPPMAQIPPSTPQPTKPPNSQANRNTPSPAEAMATDDLQVLDLDGKSVSLSSLKGKLVLLDLWSSTSPACIRALPEIAYVHRTYQPHGLEVVGVAYEDGPTAVRAERVKFVTQRQGALYTQWLGNGDNCPLLRQLEIRRIPTTLLLDGDGKVIWRMERLTPESRLQLEAVLKQQLRLP